MSQSIVPDTNEPQVAMAAIAYQLARESSGWDRPGTLQARLKMFVEAYHVLEALIGGQDGAEAKKRISAMKE